MNNLDASRRDINLVVTLFFRNKLRGISTHIVGLNNISWFKNTFIMRNNISKLLIAVFVLSCSIYSSKAEEYIVRGGVIDLTHAEWGKSPYIKLEGDWNFYWKEFIHPSKINDSLWLNKSLKATLPGSWNKIIDTKGQHLPQAGYGTYHIKIRLPNKDQVYALKMYSVFSAYKMFVNGKQVASIGTIAKTKAENNPKFETMEIPFVIQQKDNANYQIADIVIQASNYHHRRSGLQKPIYIGTIDEVINQTENGIIINILLIGIILIIGFNHVLMFVLRRLDFANLIFGVLSTIMILRNFSTGERLIQNWFPNLSWEMLVRLDNFSGFATISFFAFYFFFSFRKDFPKTMFYIIMSIGVLVTILVFSTKAWFYGQFRLLFEAYIGLGGFYLVFGVLLAATLRRRQGALWSFIGMFLLYATAVNDVLSSMDVIKTVFIAPYGIAAFMIIQSFLLTKKSATALLENQTLSSELSNEKLKLEERINERTQELTKQANELNKHKEQQEIQNWINTSLNELGEIMRQNKDNLFTLADKLLSTTVKKVNGTLGAMYFLQEDNGTENLKLIAHYGLNKESMTEAIDLQEGLVGKCFTTGKKAILEDLPKGYFDISSGLGNSTPKMVVLYPMVVDEKTIGVLEIATFKTLTDAHLNFIEKSVTNVAAQLNIVKMNTDSQTLLSNYEQYEQELKRKDEEYRQLKEELELLREQMSNT